MADIDVMEEGNANNNCVEDTRRNSMLDHMFTTNASPKILKGLLGGMIDVLRKRYPKMLDSGLNALIHAMNENDTRAMLVVYFCALSKEPEMKEWICNAEKCEYPLSADRQDVFFKSLAILTESMVQRRVTAEDYLKRVQLTLLHNTMWYANGRQTPDYSVPPTLRGRESQLLSRSSSRPPHSDPLPRKR